MRFTRHILAGGLLLTLLLAGRAGGQSLPVEREVRVGVLTDNYPFSFRGSDGRIQGFAAELVQQIEQTMNLHFKRIEGTTEEINGAFREGKIDLLQSFARSPERATSVEFSVPYLSMAGQVFVRAGGLQITRFTELRGKKVLVHRGSLGEQMLIQAGLSNSIVIVKSVEQGLIKLNEGEGDAVLATRLTGLSLAQQLGLTQLRVLDLEIPGFEVDYCLAVPKGNYVLLARVNEGMALLVRTGQFNQLYQKWFGFAAPVGYTVEQILLAVAVGLALALVVTLWAVLRQRTLRQRIVGQAESLRESETRFRQLAENIQEVFWMTDVSQQQMLYVSPAYETIWGRTCADLYQSPQNWLAAIHADDRSRIAQVVSQQAQGGYDETYRIIRPDGVLRWIRDRAFPIRNPAGEIYRLVGIAKDITERRQLEEQFRQSQKMEAIGQLAGGVAHDFNNLIAAIMMQVELVMTVKPLPEEALSELREIMALTDRAASLTRQLLAFSRRQVMQTRLLDVNESVTNLTKMLQRILGEDVRLDLQLHPQPLLTRADAGMLDQVLLNLVVNARDAMPQGGQLCIKTQATKLETSAVPSLADLKAGDYISLTVTDTGMGIVPEHLTRIFEPFFTTKDPGCGTGLGLATVFGIVKQHNGAISVTSVVGQGTRFQIWLPKSAETAAPSLKAPTKTLPRGGRETILLVEDDPVVGDLTRKVLANQGYQVLVATNGVAALKIWEQSARQIQLLYTDLVMPEGVSGQALAASLQAQQPHLCVLFTTGYSADIAGRDLVLREGQNFIPKPSSPNQILATVRRCLDQVATE